MSHTREGAEAVVMPAGDHDHIECITDQVKLTHALVWDLDEAVKEVKLLGEHEEESSQRITELEALCKRLREDTEKLREEKTTLEGMIQSHDELIMEMAEEYGVNRMGEKDDDEDEDDDDEGNAVKSPSPAPAAVPKEIIKQEAIVEMVPEQEAPMAHEVILQDAEPEPPQPRLFNMIMRDNEESPPTMENGPLWARRFGWLVWSGWWPKWRSLWHRWVVSQRWE
jgi:vacuolar-type H+-ATPase subunit I/STV1